MDEKDTLFELVTGDKKQVKCLFNLLKKRSFTISHTILPSYKIHENFVLKNPYRFWYLILHRKSYVGSFYIKYDNSIGINLNLQNTEILQQLLDFVKTNHIPSKVSASLVPPYFYVNVATNNKKLRNILVKLGGQALQVSYKI